MKGRVILQDIVSHQYLAPDGGWAASCQQARTFEHTYLALLDGLEHRDKHTQVVWCFQNPSENMYMPVRPQDSGLVLPCQSCPFCNRSSQVLEVAAGRMAARKALEVHN